MGTKILIATAVLLALFTWMVISDTASALAGDGSVHTLQAHESAKQQASGRDTPSQSKRHPIQIFIGKIMLRNGKYVLRASASTETYNLNDQAGVKPFKGKAVVITGRLYIKSNTIHVIKIKH